MKTFEPDQLVLVRECDTADWELARYSHCCTEGSNGHIHHEQGRRWFTDDDILPYTGNEYLLGTTGTPIQQWEPKPGELVAVSDTGEEDDWEACIYRGKSGSTSQPYRASRPYQGEQTAFTWAYCEPLRKHFTVSEE